MCDDNTHRTPPSGECASLKDAAQSTHSSSDELGSGADFKEDALKTAIWIQLISSFFFSPVFEVCCPNSYAMWKYYKNGVVPKRNKQKSVRLYFQFNIFYPFKVNTEDFSSV